jgi:thioredoxin reductase
VLLKRGHAATLIDSAPIPGGLMRGSFDPSVLPAIVIDGEIATLRRLGAQFRLNTALGREVTLADLRHEFDAVLLATGAPLWAKLDCPGGELGRSAGSVLADLGAGRPVDVDCDVIIVGAGQEAVETAMTVRRRQERDHKGSTSSVIVVSSRAASHMPLLVRQIEKAQSLGVHFRFEATVTEVRQPAVRYYLAANQPAGPIKLDCQLLINATGRGADLAMLSDQGVAVGPRGVTADRGTFTTSLPGVFAAGEVVSGPGFAVRAIAQGREAAGAIDLFLRGEPVVAPAHRHNVRYGKVSDEEHAMLLARTTNTGGRTARVLDDAIAKSEADRCLDCGCHGNGKCRLRQAATMVSASSGRFKGDRRALERDASHPLVNYESNKCIMCGACVAICEQASQQLGLTYVGRGFNVRVAVPWGGKLAEALGDLAARCAEACPTSAIVLKSASR